MYTVESLEMGNEAQVFVSLLLFVDGFYPHDPKMTVGAPALWPESRQGDRGRKTKNNCQVSFGFLLRK